MNRGEYAVKPRFMRSRYGGRQIGDVLDLLSGFTIEGIPEKTQSLGAQA